VRDENSGAFGASAWRFILIPRRAQPAAVAARDKQKRTLAVALRQRAWQPRSADLAASA
jgi:hypothetical protein